MLGALEKVHFNMTEKVVHEVCLHLSYFVVEHLQFKLQFSLQFKNKRKFGGKDLLNEKVKFLETEIADQFHIFRANNNEKLLAA